MNRNKDNKSGRLNIGVNAEEPPLPQSASDMTPKRIYIRTFGWQMDAVLYDFCAVFK